VDMVNQPVVRWRARTAMEKCVAAMAAQCVRLGVERARVRASVGFVASLRTSQPDWWDRGRCTGATVLPHGGQRLTSVGHCRRRHSLNGGGVTD
jgi:hypothetical protein